MAKKEKIISTIEKTIDSKVESWSKSMPKIEEDIFNELVRLTGELEEINGRIKPSVKNVKTIGKIKAILTKVIFDKKYDEELQDVVDTLDEITKLQNQYFTQVNKKFKVPNVVKEVQQLSIDGVISQLGKTGLDANILSPLRDILVKNVNSGGTKKEFLEQAKAFITKTEGGEGRLSRYTKQIVTDSLNQYSANYNAIISDDLGYEWFIYSGSNKDTTREFCRAITECKDLRYIHRSQFNDLLEGKICNTTIKLNKKTGLPDGMIEGTNTLNFHTNRGGYNCNHQLTGVPTAIVPKEYLDKIKSKVEVKESIVGKPPTIMIEQNYATINEKVYQIMLQDLESSKGFEQTILNDRNKIIDSLPNSKEITKALFDYKGNAYKYINRYNKNKEEFINQLKSEILGSPDLVQQAINEELEKAKKQTEDIDLVLEKSSVPKNIVGYRGAALEIPGLECDTDMDGNYNRKIKGNHLSIIGTDLNENIFKSVSLNQVIASAFMEDAIRKQYRKRKWERKCKIPVIMTIFIDKGVNGVSMEGLRTASDEREILLARKYKYYVYKVEKKIDNDGINQSEYLDLIVKLK